MNFYYIQFCVERIGGEEGHTQPVLMNGTFKFSWNEANVNYRSGSFVSEVVS